MVLLPWVLAFVLFHVFALCLDFLFHLANTLLLRTTAESTTDCAAGRTADAAMNL